MIDNKFPKRILIAEDDRINQKLVVTILQSLGYEVQCVDNGMSAFEEATTGKYCGILMDIEMPQLDGLKAVQRIREYERKNGGHVPIIAMTNYSDKESREGYFASGMDDYLSKPFKPFELAEVLRRAGL